MRSHQEDPLRRNELRAALALSNLGTGVDYSDGSEDELDKVLKIGFGYQSSYGPLVNGALSEIVGLTASVQYSTLVNRLEWSVLGFGGEVAGFSALSLRLGHRFPLGRAAGGTVGRVGLGAWGFGCRVPLYRFSDLPLDLGYDYALPAEFSWEAEAVHTWFLRYVF